MNGAKAQHAATTECEAAAERWGEHCLRQAGQQAELQAAEEGRFNDIHSTLMHKAGQMELSSLRLWK